jgi:hypothetical protein
MRIFIGVVTLLAASLFASSESQAAGRRAFVVAPVVQQVRVVRTPLRTLARAVFTRPLRVVAPVAVAPVRVVSPVVVAPVRRAIVAPVVVRQRVVAPVVAAPVIAAPVVSQQQIILQQNAAPCASAFLFSYW